MIIRKTVKIFFLLYAFLVFLLTLVGGCNVFIRPDYFPLAALTGIFYPILLILDLINILIFLVNKQYRLVLILLLPFLSIFWHLPALFHTTKNSGLSDKQGLRLMTYNVEQLGYYNWNFNKIIRDSIILSITNENCDIVCMQEFFHSQSGRFPVEPYFDKYYQNKFLAYNASIFTTEKFGYAIYSKFPVCDTASFFFEGTTNGFTVGDIQTNIGIIRVINCHLESFRFYQEHFLLHKDPQKWHPKRIYKYIRNLNIRLAQGYKKRVIQTEALIQQALNSPYPVIICGDFNDVPFSYIYYRLKKYFSDAWVETGKGSQVTYPGLLWGHRIDYVFYAGKIKPIQCQVKALPFSDHYPVICNFMSLSDK